MADIRPRWARERDVGDDDEPDVDLRERVYRRPECRPKAPLRLNPQQHGGRLPPGARVDGRTVAAWLRYDAEVNEPPQPFVNGFHFASWRAQNR